MTNIKLSSGIVIFLFLLVTLLFKTDPLQADKVDRLYQKAAAKYHLLYKKGKFRRKAHNWLGTIETFQRIHRSYPRHRKAPSALFNVGKLYRSLYRWNRKSLYLDRSNLAFKKLVRKYPKSSLADDSQFLLALNYEQYKKNKSLAFIEYRKLTQLFPRGDHNKKARAKLRKLKPYVKSSVVKRKPKRSKPPAVTVPAAKNLKDAPRIKGAVTPALLTKPRYGGLSAKANARKKSVSLVSKVNYWSTTDWSRMVINVKDAVRYKYQTLKRDRHGRKRIYMDIFNAYLPKKFKRKIAADDGLINQARVAQFNKKTVRIVLDIASIEKIAVFHFKKADQYKIVIDILGKSRLDDLDLRQAGGDKVKPRNKGEPISLSKAFGLKVRKIVIDPGHGGRDPGAMFLGLKEKDVALKISLMLKRFINKRHPDIKVLMTRATDRYIKLEARTAFANKNKADLFISVHVNAAPRRNLRGVETYYLNLTSDNDALSLAAKENEVSMKSISDLQGILNNLMKNAKIKESRVLATEVQNSMINTEGNYKLVSLGVKQAPFLVLVGARMPSILVEAGFLTNRRENRCLRTSSCQRLLASRIYKGVKSYIDRL